MADVELPRDSKVSLKPDTSLSFLKSLLQLSGERSSQGIKYAGEEALREPESGEIISISEPLETFVNNTSAYQSRNSECQQVPRNPREGLKGSLLGSVARWMRRKVSRVSTLKRKRAKRKRVSNSLLKLFGGDRSSSSHSQRNLGGRSSIDTGEGQKRIPQPTSRRETQCRGGFVLDILFQTASGSRSRRRAKMDTGAEENLITQNVASDLGFETEKYIGNPLQPLGPIYQPDKEITLSWNVLGREELYKTRFCVVPDKFARNFDVLIGEDWIVENEALRRNPDVCN